MKLQQACYLLIGLSIYGKCFSQDSIMELPISSVKGYSLFHPYFAGKAEEPSENDFKKELIGIPSKLKNLKRFHIIFNEKQFYYQEYLSKNISDERYKILRDFAKIEPNEEEYVKSLIKASVYVVVGEDETGNQVWMADTDIDLDFSDEVVRPLLKYGSDADAYKAIADNAVEIKAQIVEKGKVIPASSQLAFVEGQEAGSYLFNHPTHYTADLKVDEQTYELKINRQNFLFFRPEETTSEMMVLTDSIVGKLIEPGAGISDGQYFSIGSNSFQYLGMDVRRNVVKVKRAGEINEDLQSAQVGLTLPQFSGVDFMTGQQISTSEFKGKYIYIDFWATWCGPCIKEFPRLKQLDGLYSKDKFEIIGIVGASEEDAIRKVIQKRGLSWKQIHSDEIVDLYQVKVYPTTFLISPDGKIIDKDLRGEKLEKRLEELIQ